MKRSVGITFAAAVALALASNAWGANDKKLGLEVVSSPPQYVTGGDARDRGLGARRHAARRR